MRAPGEWGALFIDRSFVVGREICGSLNVQRRGKLQVADRLSCQISYSGVFRQVRLTFPLRASGPQRRGQ
jgi:hypothetical protein